MWVQATRFEALRESRVIGVQVQGTPVALYLLSGEVFATHGICTHALALLSEGFVENGTVECPLHQGVFDIRSGRALCAPVTRDLQTYAVKVEGGDVFINLTESRTSAFTVANSSDKLETDLRTAVIIGAGQAATAAIRAMRGAGYAGRIILVGEEKHLPYERPPLSKQFLLESVEVASIQCLSQSDAEKFDVELRLGVQATQVDSERRTITLADGNILPYDTLLFSSGGRARKLNVPGSDLPGLYYLRSLDDAQAISEALSSAKRAVIVGGGFIGLELASTARARGLSVTLVEAESELMQRLLPAALGRAFRALAERNGVRVSLATPVTSIEGLGGQVSVITPSERLDADLVLVGVGMEPRTELAEQAGCHVDGGILIDREGRTSVPGIWAAGDCTLHHIAIDGMRVRRESWHNAEHQGTAAGRSIAATPEHNPAEEPAWFWTDQFGMNIQIVGHPGRNDEVVLIGQNGREGAVYRTIDPRSGRLTSVTAFANPQAIREARSELRDQLHSGPGSADTARLNPQTHAGSDGEAKMYVNAPTFESKYLWPGEGLSRVPDWVYTDQVVYQREVERIFHGRTWNYVALEGEIENPGDFIRSNVGPTPVVVSRADDGSIHVFENRCAHRAAEFCRELSGNSREFVCPYHQWTYDLTGALTGVPFRRGVNGKGGMPKDFKISEHGLRRLNVTRHRGVVFASYAEDMEPLAEYLGPEVLAEFEATFDGRKPKVLGYYRHSLPGNWKLYHENLKDPYHATLLHTFLVTFGLLVAGNKSLMLADKSGRHGVMASAKSDAKSLSAENKKEMRAYKEGMTLEDPRFMDFIDEFDSPWSVTMATIWPNLIIQREMNTLGVRQIVPTGPHEFIMKWTMFGFDGDDNEMTRHRLRQGNLMGPAGFLGLEDNEAIKFVQDGMQRVPNGEHLVELDPETPVGTSETLISEAAIRAMYKHWREVMGIEQASQ